MEKIRRKISFKSSHSRVKASHASGGMATFRCNGADHTGDRWMPLSEKSHGRKCRACKAADTRRRTGEKAAERATMRRGRFASADAWEKFNRDEFVRKEGKHRYVVPVAEEFASVESFEDAWRRHVVREREGGDGRDSAREYMDRDNAKRREAYVPVEPKAPKIPEGPQRCSRCSEMKPLVSFRPSEVEKETKKRVAFDEVLSHILASDATRESHPDLFAAWDEVRTSQCVSCREYHRSYVADEETTAGQCRALWYELRKAPCVDCGRDDGFSEYDHQADRGEKVHIVGDWNWWKWNGGVEAMRLEATKCEPRCRNCHQLQPSNNAYKRKYPTLE